MYFPHNHCFLNFDQRLSICSHFLYTLVTHIDIFAFLKGQKLHKINLLVSSRVYFECLVSPVDTGRGRHFTQGYHFVLEDVLRLCTAVGFNTFRTGDADLSF